MCKGVITVDQNMLEYIVVILTITHYVLISIDLRK